MKSHKRPTPIEPDVDEALADGPGKDDSRRPTPVLPKPVRTASGFDAAFLSVLGVGCVAGGLTLALGPKMSWKLEQIATGFKHLGVEGGVLVMGGLLLAALGMLRRGQIALRTPTVEQAEDRQLLEQLAKDTLRLAENLSHLESGITHLETHLASSRRAVEERVGASTAEVLTAIATPRENNSGEEAIYRLAASLDQVGMRIEQRLKTQYTALQDHLEDVGAAILSARNQVQGLQRAREEHAAALRDEVQTQVETALEETGFWSNSREPNKGPSLGVLDTIDDGATAHHESLESVSAALPLNPEEAREHGVATPREYDEHEPDTQTRLIQLSSLLADPKLRSALESMREKHAS
jgi:hypothetical protein